MANAPYLDGLVVMWWITASPNPPYRTYRTQTQKWLHKPICSVYVPFMPNYRRLLVPGGTYAFTVCLENRGSRALTDHADAFHCAYANTQIKYPFETIAWVILPDHLHVVWKLPDGDDDFAVRWRLIKTRFTKSVADSAQGRRPGERAIWQRRFWEHLIRDEDDLKAHVDYIHWNPVKHGLVTSPDDWPHSSWHGYKEAFGREWRPGVDLKMGEAA